MGLVTRPCSIQLRSRRVVGQGSITRRILSAGSRGRLVLRMVVATFCALSWNGAIVRTASALVSRTARVKSTHLMMFDQTRRERTAAFRHFAASGGASIEDQQSDERPPPVNNKNNKPKKERKKPAPRPKKFTLGPDFDENLLAKAFDALAKKDGFDSSLSKYADASTFDRDFTEEDYDKFIDADDDGDAVSPTSSSSSSAQRDMAARLAQAKSDQNLGTVTIPDTMTGYLESLGYREEENPFGNDETPRNKAFIPRPVVTLIADPWSCSACGAAFQASDQHRPGYLPPEKFEVQTKVAKLQELERLKAKASEAAPEWSADDEIEWLLQTKKNEEKEKVAEIDIEAAAQEMGIDLEAVRKKRVICKRCHALQNFGTVEDVLRPGWTEDPMLSQENFRQLLRPIGEKEAVLIALVDLFDFSGSVLPELDSIAGDNPVILAANKADLLPSKMGAVRAESWVRRELEYIGVKSLANVGGAVRLVSCKTGQGVAAMLDKAKSLAAERKCDIYLVGAANSGKSTLMNRILAPARDPSSGEKTIKFKVRAGNKNKIKDVITTSPLPGTTLKFLKADVGDGMSLYDTPGLLVPGTLTQLLTSEELKVVVPKSNVEPITFRIASGKAILIGGFAKIELIGETTKPFFFTIYVANEIKLHPTDSARADEFIQNHIGGMLTPPLTLERYKELGEFEQHEIVVEGMGWKEAAADIALTGLGWVAVTGAGQALVRVSVPKGIGVSLRPPLMPFDVWETTASYTGGRAVRKVKKPRFGTKKQKGVGRN